MLAACGRDDDSAKGTSTSSRLSSTTTSTTSASSITTTTSAAGSSTTTTPADAGTCGPQYFAIDAAIRGSDMVGLAAVADKFSVVDCRISAANPIWAAASAVPTPGNEATFEGGVVVLERIGSIWTVHAVGTDQVGCDAPAPVPNELDLPC